MSKNYVQSNDVSFASQLRNFYLKLITYATLLGFSHEEIDEAKADSTLWDFLVDADNKAEKFARDYKQTKNLLRYGKGNEISNTLPQMPDLGTPPVMVSENIQYRFTQKANKAKASANYTTAIGVDLGIEATQQTFDPTQGKPNLSTYLNAGHPELEYKKGKYGGIAIYKDSGMGYSLLTRAFMSHYTDKSPLPEVGTTQLWKYKAIYLWHDEEVGSWSDDISIAVIGH